jgi:hypothetical protein
VLATFVRALPFTYRSIEAPAGTAIVFNQWSLVREDSAWRLYEGHAAAPVTTVAIPDDVVWRMFTKQRVDPGARIEGDRRLAEPLFGTVAVIG